MVAQPRLKFIVAIILICYCLARVAFLHSTITANSEYTGGNQTNLRPSDNSKPFDHDMIDTTALLHESAKQCAVHNSSNLDIDCIDSIVPVHSNARGCDLMNFGSYHKMGTTLSNKLWAAMCPGKGRDGIFPHTLETSYTNGTPFVHFIRDPLESVVSAYQYHLKCSREGEPFIVDTGFQDQLRNATVADGLDIQFKWSLKMSIRMLMHMHEFFSHPSRRQNVFTVRMEEIRDDAPFRTTVYAIEKWLRLPRHLSWEELQDCCFVSEAHRKDGKGHTTKLDEKGALRQIVMSQHGDEIRDIRRHLGFPLAGVEEEARV